MAIALLSGPNDPSQGQNNINALITSINGYVGGTPGGPGVSQAIQVGTTGANLPVSGVVVLSTGSAYTLPKPTAAQLGQQVTIIMGSTKTATVAGNFFSTKTKMTFTSTAALTTVQRLPGITLIANSTAATTAWKAISMIGTVKTT